MSEVVGGDARRPGDPADAAGEGPVAAEESVVAAWQEASGAAAGPADPPEGPAGRAGRSSRLAAAEAAARTRAAWARERLDTTRAKVPAVDAAMSVQERDKRLAGNLLASALAYRLFLWLLPVLLVLVAGLGFLRDAGPEDPVDAARKLGLSAFVGSSVASASDQAQKSRWILLAIGLVALYFASTAGVKALRAVHTLAWNLPHAKPRSMPANVLGFVVFALGAIVATATASWLRDRSDGPGLLATLAIVVLYGLLYLVATWRLPHADCPWTALLPGALLVSIGAQVLHLVTVYYLVGKLQTSSELYGSLGAAAAVLLWLFFVGRLIVAAALLNATLWERRQARAAEVAPTTAPLDVR